MINTALVVVFVVVGLLVALQVFVRLKARAMRGKTVPALPGAVGRRLAEGNPGLLYFFSPSCGACRQFTPPIRDLSEKNPNVYLVDVTREMEVARALQVMGTPSFVEVSNGKIVGCHVGSVPPAVIQRYS